MTLGDAMQVAVDWICAHTGWPVGHAYLLAEDVTGELVSTNIWHVQDPGRFEPLRTSAGTRLGPGVALAGRVLLSGKPAWIMDVTEDPDFQVTKAAREVGISAGFAFPVLVGSEVVAVLEFLSDRRIEPTDRLLDLMALVGTQLGRVVERKRADQTLRESEQRYRLLAENVVDVIWTADMSLGLTYVSPSVKRLSGYSVEEALAQPLEERLTPGSAQTARRALAEIVPAAPGTTQADQPLFATLELELRCKDGSTVWTESKIALLFDPAGRPVGTLGVTRDITARRQLEDQFRQAQKMEAVGRLAGGVAHDFNNLLTIIMGYNDLLLSRFGHDDSVRRDIELIQENAGRAAALTRQLLAFSRRQFLAPQVLDLGAVVAKMDRMLRRLIGEDIELVTVPSPALGRVRADPSQVEQVILNLAINARDAMPGGGRLTIETANVELDRGYARRHVDVRPGPHVMVAVSDTGEGMDPETQAHLFEPFFTTKELGKGSGLGLSTVYGIVKQNGGNIWVYSELGHGTTFKIYLPRVEDALEPTEPLKPLAGPARGSETVLVVEDNEAVRVLTRKVLVSYGYTVLEARDGNEALRISECHAGPIQLLLTDTVMPQLSGRELAERLRRARPETKALYMSGYTDDAIVRHGVLDPHVAFLQKPFTSDALARKVREVLDAP